MASSELVRQMNGSLRTKLDIYKNMSEYVERKPAIFTSRAEIWSTDTNPVIITGLPFPSVSPSDNPHPGDLTREMMEYYGKLSTLKEQGGHHINLILFEFQVHGITEVHAVFSRRQSSANEVPEKIYLKNLVPTEVLSRQHSTDPSKQKTSRTSVSMVLAGETDALPASISRDTRRFSVRTTSEEDRAMGSIESRFDPKLSENLGIKVKISSDSARSDLSVTSRSLVSAEYRCYSSPTMEGVLESYVRHHVKVERSLRNLISSFEALSTSSVDEGDKYDYSISCSSTFSTESDQCRKICDKLGAITPRLSRPLMVNLDKKLREYENRTPEAQHLAYIFTNDARMWKTYRHPKIEITELPPIPPEYDHKKNDIVQDIVEYIRLNHIMMKWPDWEPIYVATLQIETGLQTEVHILLSPHQENAAQYYLHTGLQPSLDPPSSRAHSLPEVAPRTRTRSVGALLKEDSEEDVADPGKDVACRHSHVQ